MQKQKPLAVVKKPLTAIKKPLAIVKVGGNIVQEPYQRECLADNVQSLLSAGWQVIILHGGGPQTSALQKALKLEPKIIEGRRVTDRASLMVVQQAIVGQVNVDLVSSLISTDINAFCCHGASGKLIQASKRLPMLLSDGEPYVDFGEVGDVTDINTRLLEDLLSSGLVPVIATLGIDHHGRVFNINADTTVTKMAISMKADLLLLTTAVGGIYRNIADKNSRIPIASSKTVRSLIQVNTIYAGMIPKVTEAVKTLQEGVKQVVILSPIDKSAFLSAAKGEHLYGTCLTL